MRRKNTIAKTRIDRKLLCLGSLAPLYGGKKNGFFRVETPATFMYELFDSYFIARSFAQSRGERWPLFDRRSEPRRQANGSLGRRPRGRCPLPRPSAPTRGVVSITCDLDRRGLASRFTRRPLFAPHASAQMTTRSWGQVPFVVFVSGRNPRTRRVSPRWAALGFP